MTLGERLLSRKFWLAVGAVVFFAFNRAFDQIATVVVAYLAVQAGVDAFGTYYEARTAGATAPAAPPLEGDHVWTEITD